MGPVTEKTRFGVRSTTMVMAAVVAGALVATVAPSQATGPTTDEKGANRRAARAERAARALEMAAKKARKKWLRGKLSHTYEQSPISGQVYTSTVEFVAYKGKKNATWPRVGNVYLAQIWVGRAGDDSSGNGVVTEIDLPRKTRFVKGKRIRCYLGRVNGKYRQLRGRKCVKRPRRGFYGSRLVPRRGYWSVPRRRWIQIIFPIRSSRKLKGLAAAPPHCLEGAVQNLSGYVLDDWDAPRRGETCPHPDGQGPYQGVFVAGRKRR